MSCQRMGILWAAAAIAVLSVSSSRAETPNIDPVVAALGELADQQQTFELPVRVVDAKGMPVAKARVIPWALRSSQGHGWWRAGDTQAGFGPKEVFTDAAGNARVLYPRYRDVHEQIRTISVSLRVDHPKFTLVDGLHIDVPLETKEPHLVELIEGVALEVHPLLDGVPADLDQIFALWSDGRSWQSGAAAERLPDNALRISALPPGENSVLLVKLDGDRATHFSEISDVKLAEGEPKRIDVSMRPSRRFEGVLSDNVPRPVRNGRIKSWTLPPAEAAENRVQWFSWAPIRADGTFTVDGWPIDEPLQLIALCDGYIATSGKAPDAVVNPRDPDKDPFNRPQVFSPDRTERIEVAMTPLSRCVATALDEDEKPVAGITVVSWPNVAWWNHGSQIYCHPLVRSERFLRNRDYHNSVDKDFPQPFQSQTDGDGKVVLELPTGSRKLAVKSDIYELPAFLGRRNIQVELTRDATTEAVLRLQPRGTEKLGEWDKLAGVVFGCSTREGRRICALPGVRKQMDEFARRFREAKNRRDPELLSEAYSAVADAFVGVGDHVEAAKWRMKAAEQAAKAKRTPESPAN